MKHHLGHWPVELAAYRYASVHGARRRNTERRGVQVNEFACRGPFEIRDFRRFREKKHTKFMPTHIPLRSFRRPASKDMTQRMAAGRRGRTTRAVSLANQLLRAAIFRNLRVILA